MISLEFRGVRGGVVVCPRADTAGVWRCSAPTVDVVPGRGSGFSLDAREGVRLLIRWRLLTGRDRAELNGCGGPSTRRAGRPSRGPARPETVAALASGRKAAGSARVAALLVRP